jgi:hypothetical protein
VFPVWYELDSYINFCSEEEFCAVAYNAVYFVALRSLHLYIEATVPSKSRLAFNRLQGLIFQKI